MGTRAQRIAARGDLKRPSNDDTMMPTVYETCRSQMVLPLCSDDSALGSRRPT